ncbi:hypothetical protein JB92DRAFT_3002938, partial [Gautieria morchelliformis]
MARYLSILGLSGALVALLVSSQAVHASTAATNAVPPQTVLIDVPGLAVLGANGNFRDDTPWNPTNTTPPVFQVWDSSFLDILGSNPSVRLISGRDDFAFAHEAPIWIPATNEVFFAGNDGGPLGMSSLTRNNQVFKISLKDVYGTGPQNITFTKVHITPELQMVNGGTPSGRGSSPPGISLVNPNPPYNSTTILDNIHGRQFNSLNDAKIHPKSGAIFFTDVDYGFINDFRPPPLLPNQAYRFDPKTSQLRVVADGFDKCNGIAFSPDGSVAYIVDSGASVKGGYNSTEAATLYAFDVDEKTQVFTNRRVLAWVDTGVPDG